MTTEARDALATALASVHREADPEGRDFALADPILAALPAGWVLARREDAEDGAVVEEAAIAKALTYLRRQVEVMGEDGECSVRRISGREYVTKDDVLLLVDERLGFALFITDTAAARKAKDAL